MFAVPAPGGSGWDTYSSSQDGRRPPTHNSPGVQHIWGSGLLGHESMGTSQRYVWRYDLAPNGDSTDVTLTYDWSGTPPDFRERVGTMPVFAEDYLAASLVTLERSVAS